MSSRQTRSQGFGERVYELRCQLGLSRSKLARIVGVSEITIFRWEKWGQLPKSHPILQRLASALRTTPQYLLTGEEALPRLTDQPYPRDLRPLEPEVILIMLLRQMGVPADEIPAILNYIEACSK
jgi:transcriptional regulator with XRE-family HTH domain